MSVINLESLSNDELRKRIAPLALLEDCSDECGQCGHPTLLHKGGPCTRKENEPPDVMIKIWSDLRKRARPILLSLKEIFWKETEHSLLLEGLQRFQKFK